MKKLFLFALILTYFGVQGQSSQSAFKSGEWLKFRMHYGFLNASYATLQVNSATIDDKSVYHVVGHGETTGVASWFFKVDDTYESYFDKQDGKPYRFVRKIDEGGYTKDVEINFDYKTSKAELNDKKNKETGLAEIRDSLTLLDKRTSSFESDKNDINIIISDLRERLEAMKISLSQKTAQRNSLKDNSDMRAGNLIAWVSPSDRARGKNLTAVGMDFDHGWRVGAISKC